MADANEMYEAIMRELEDVVICDSDQSEEELESVLYREDADFHDFPPSLLRYFATSKSRAAVCEKFIRVEPEDTTASHHIEDTMNCHIEVDKDMMTLNEQVNCGSAKENNTSTDIRPFPAPTETEALFTHNVSVCPDNEDEAGTNTYMESERHLAFEIRIPNKTIEYEAEQDKLESKEMYEEQKTQTERDFQRELRRIMDSEKRHQKELELMEKRAQEKLKKEFLLQQELISNLQRQVEEERRMREEERKRIKDEKDKRKREEENIKMEAERRRMEEETRRKKEEDRQIEEMKCKKEERKNNEEEMRRIAREEKKSVEDERKKIELQRKKLEDEMRTTEEEEMRKKKEEVERIKREEEMGKREEEIKKIEEARKEWEKMEKEKRKMEEQSDKKEDELRKKVGKERKKMEKENMGIKEEGRVTKEMKERKMREKNENDAADWKKVAQKKMYEELGKGDKREQGIVDELKPVERKRKEENYSKKTEEVEKEEAKNKEIERKKMEERIDTKEVVRKQEGEHRTIKEIRSNEEDETRKLEDERKTKEEEQLQKETRRLRDDKDDRKSEEEMKLHKDECDGQVDNRKRGQQRKTKDTEKKNNGKSENVNAEKEKDEEEVGEKKEEVVRVIRANEAQKKMEHDSIVGQDESMLQPEVSSKIEDGTTWTSSSPGPLQSTICPTTNEVCQTSADEIVDCENQAAKPSSASVCLPVCLPQHTEHKRLSWMKDCISWSHLSLQNKRKHRVSAWSKRGARRAAEASSLPPLPPRSLLQSTSWRSLQEVTTVTLEDLPGCSLSTLAQCPQLQSLSLRRCGLKSLEGIKQLQQLCYIDVQENDISYVDCENMPGLRVLHLGHNKLTSIHGLAGTEYLDVLELSHNSITRIAGLESMRRLQRLSVDHNQLISTKGLKDVYTLLHLNCSHNHLARVEGLENNALLNTLDLRANSLTEPPSLYNQVLLRELYLDDNSISSLQGLTACWLPLMQHLSVAQNRITQLPPVSDALSLSKLDLQFNCMSELQNVCESLEGCQFLREICLTGNPLQQENDWRSSLQKAVPGLRAIDDQETDSYLSPPAVQQVNSASDSFLMFCQAQLQETHDLQQRHRRELSNVSSSLDAMKISCRHFAEALQLATDQRFAHEHGDTTVADKRRTACQTAPEEMLDVDSANSEKHDECPEIESTGEASPLTPNSDSIGCSYRTFDEKPVVESWHDIFDTVPKTGPTVSRASSGSAHSLAMKSKTSANLELAPVSNHQDLDLKNTAAVVIQQRWRKYRQKCEMISSPVTAEKGGGDGGEPESGPSHINRRVVGQDYAATVIQAFWRGFILRRRLTSALTAVTCLDTREDDTFEEVDINEFVFDEAELENNWTLPLSEDSPPRYYPVSERPLHLKYIHPPPVVWESKQAWVSPEQVDPCVQRVPPVSSNRSCSPASASVVSGLSERSEKILEEWGFTHSHTAHLMLKRAQRMKPKKPQPKKYRDPSIHLASFRHHSCQPGKVEVRNWQAQDNRKYMKVGEAELGPRQAEKTEPLQQEGVHSDSESVHFLPEISPDILNGGRVQLVADPGYAERLHHASGSWANSSLAGQPSKENDYPQRNSLSHGREKVPSPKQATSAPSRTERISFRDNPVQMSGGWGGGKKRNKL